MNAENDNAWKNMEFYFIEEYNVNDTTERFCIELFKKGAIFRHNALMRNSQAF